MDASVEISSSTVNCQLYQMKYPKNDFRCMFQTNSAEKQTQAHSRYLLRQIFGAKTDAVARVSPPFF